MNIALEAEQRRDWMKSRRKMRKAARRAHRRRQMIHFCLMSGLLVIGALGFTHLPWSLHNNPTEIVIHGNSVTTRQQILDVLKMAMNEPVYRLDPHQLEQKLESLKAVRHAFVRRYALPQPRLVVEVLEEHPWASYSADPSLPPSAVIAQSGRFIPVAEFPTVIRPDLIIYGRPSLTLTSHEVVQWASWINYIAAQTGRPVNSIDMRQPFEVQVQDGDLKLKLGTPDTTLTRRLGRLVSVLPAVEQMQQKQSVDCIDLSLDNSIPLKVSKLLPHKNTHTLAQNTGSARSEHGGAGQVAGPFSSQSGGQTANQAGLPPAGAGQATAQPTLSPSVPVRAFGP